MKTFTKFICGVLASLILFTSAEAADKKVITMGSAGLYAEMVEIISELIDKDKYEVKLVTIDSNSGAADGAVNGDIDCFMYNHEPWLMQYNKSKGADFKVVDHLYYGRSGLYSDKHEKLEDLPDGATLAICNDSVNMENNLKLLERFGLIKLGSKSANDAFLTPLDIVENPKGFKFYEVEISYAARSLPEVDGAIVPATQILQTGRDPNKFLAEDLSKKDYPIGITTLAKNVDEQWLKDVVKVVESKEFAKRFNETYKGAMVLYSDL